MMFIVAADIFDDIVRDAIDAIPNKHGKHIKNVAFVVEDQPSPEQREKLRLRNNQSLFGLYEGHPLPNRASGYNLALPDKITLFKSVIGHASSTEEEVRKIVNNTVWHEVAHYFGLNHDQIHKLENNIPS